MGKINMQRISKTLLLLSAVTLLLAELGCRSTPAQNAFSNWPAGTSPREVGERVAENFVARKLDFEANPRRQFVIYPEVCGWYGSLLVAAFLVGMAGFMVSGGHAAAGHVFMQGAESTRLSIKMRGGSLGHHQALDKEERFSRFRSEEMARLVWTLGAMAAAGDLDTLRTAGGESLFRRCERQASHHHHLVCRRCGRTVEVQGPNLESWVRTTAGEHGFRDVEHTLELFGTCADCAAAGD